jgi:hypothetical protein
MLETYVFCCYAISLISMITSYVNDPDGEITAADLVVFLTSPFSAVPIILVFILSQFVDLDRPLLKK